MKAPASNPYIVGNPIKSREMFFGREDDFHFVARKVGEGKANQLVVLTGERRSGKTSILFQILGGRLGPSFLPVLIDMQMLAGVNGDAGFYSTLARCGYECLGGGQSLSGLDVNTNPERFLEDFLRYATLREPGKTVLFLFDEYEILEQKIKDGALGESTLQYLAWALESSYPVSFIFTGSTNLEDRDHAIWRLLLGKSVYRKISYLSRGDTVRLITEPLRGQVEWPPDLVESICRLSGGQPFYTQVICQNLVDLLIDEDRNDPRGTDLEKIVAEIVANPLPQMIYFWNSFPPHDRVMLSALAGEAAGSESWLDTKALLDFLRKSRVILPFDREKASVLLENAYHRELLEKNDNGAYRFRMDLFRRWVRREHSIWKVVKEANLVLAGGRRRSLRLLGLGALAIAVLSLAWFFIFAPARGENSKVREDSGAQAQSFVANIDFKANRGPFVLMVDDSDLRYRSSESSLGPTWIIVPSLAAGKHDFVARTEDGAEARLADVLVSPTSNSFHLEFPDAAGQKTATSTLAPVPADSVLSASFFLETDPTGATVYDGNDYKGVTPIDLRLIPGFHPIHIIHEGYASQFLNISLSAGETRRQKISLAADWAVITFAWSEPASAYVDGSFLTDLPSQAKLRIHAGKHELSIIANSTKARHDIKLDLAAGAVFTVTRDTR